MSQFCIGTKSFVAGEALDAYRRVKLSSATVVYADADEAAIGVTAGAAASGASVAVDLFGNRTHKVTASAAVAADAVVYGKADGKVDDAAGVYPIGIALEAALADGDIIEVCFNANAVVPYLTALAAVDAPTGGSTTDAEARTAINAIIARLVSLGVLTAEA